MRKVAALAAVVTMSLGSLTACSGGDYCAELTGYVAAAKGLKIEDSEAVEKMRVEAEKLSKSAPDDLKDDWKLVLDYAQKAKDAGGDQAKLAELAKNDGPKIAPAMATISKHAKDTCKVDLEG